jgi:hypothetical protein
VDNVLFPVSRGHLWASGDEPDVPLDDPGSRGVQAFGRGILEWDFERLITGHGEIVEGEGKRELREAVETAVGKAG